jgi:hypothetical protein
MLVSVTLVACGVSAPSQGSGAGAEGGAQPAASAGVRRVEPVSALLHPKGKFFGLEVDGAPASLNPVTTVAAETGKNPDLLGQYISWNVPFDAAAAANSSRYGALYYVSWEPFGASLQAIANGGSDAYITRFARAVKAFGNPVAISFGHEFNGNWYPWGTTSATAAEFVAAWRRIHDLFAAAGAKNVIWVWNTNIINPMPDVALKPYWPGSKYVDWVGLTGYFATTGPHTFAGIYGPTITEVRRFTSSPFIVAETSVETGPSEIQSVHNLIGGVEGRSDVLGFIWFNYDKSGIDWTLGGRSEIRAAVAGSLAGMPLVSMTR